ncbi:MAG: aminodeoxychorismate lyase [Candidatus Methylopumilus sp.]|nr:aminodeoxychorismate lyase [Candidatus Methylopumilus sp.]
MSKQFLINGSASKKISPFDRAFQYGDGIFRTFVVEHQIPRHWKYHYQKIVDDCRAINILPPKEKDLLSDIKRLFKTQKKAVGKFIISRGESLRGYQFSSSIKPNRFLLKTKIPTYPTKNFALGVNLTICKQHLHPSMLSGIKHLNRLDNVMARNEWKDRHYVDGILLDPQGQVIECISSNLFFRMGKIIYTHPLKNIGVKGVTRNLIFKIAPTLGFKMKEVTFNFNKLLKADEVFITNSLFGVWQVKKIKNTSWQQQSLASLLNELLKAIP